MNLCIFFRFETVSLFVHCGQMFLVQVLLELQQSLALLLQGTALIFQEIFVL
jgi:hypothetical protein